uniref:kelch-like protein 5 n=1 Tax=Styela clava TaxID=7725 RepID=UPI00193AB954|nr:kelch-like protein 5 [Styela clava]
MAFNLSIDKNSHNTSMMKKLDNMRKEKRHSDLTIKVGSEEFLVHRNIISAGSDYFDAMLSHDNLESNTGIVNMKEVDVDSVKICIDYIYTEEASITLEKCEELFHAASIMQLSVLCDNIIESLKNKLNPKSFFQIRGIANNLNQPTLKKSCDDYAFSNLGALANQEEFNKIDFEYISILVGRNNISYSEDSKLSLFLTWIKSDPENRKKYIVEMDKLMQLSKVSSEYATYLSEKDPIFQESTDHMKMLILMFSKTKGEPAAIPMHVPAANNTLILFNKNLLSMRTFQPNIKGLSGTISIKRDLTGYHQSFTAVVWKQNLFVFTSSAKVYQCAFHVNGFTNWSARANTKFSHSQFLKVVVYKDFAYIVGDNLMEKYNLTNDISTKIDNIAVVCSYCSLAECGGFIYVLGGHTNSTHSGNLRSVNRYCPASSCWNVVRSMNVARQIPGVAVYNGKIYVAGGYDTAKSLSSCEYFDPQTNNWTNLPSISVQGTEKYDFRNGNWNNVTELGNLNIEASASVSLYLEST